MSRSRSLVPTLCLLAILGGTLHPKEAWAQKHPMGSRGSTRPVAGGEIFIPAGFSKVALFATNSIDLNQNSSVESGSVVVNENGSDPTLGCSGRELCVGIGVTTPAGFDVKAHAIQIKQNGAIHGAAFCNSLLNNGSQSGLTCSSLALPVFVTPPTFVAEDPRPTAPDVFVSAGGSAVVGPGDYDVIDTNQDGVVTFTGGVYNVNELDFGIATTLKFLGASEVRVSGKASFDEHSFVGPAAGSGISAADIVFFVAGINGSNGNLNATPPAAKIGIAATAQANFYVPNGTLQIRQDAVATGAFLGRDVLVGPGAEVHLASFFANRPPTAHPQDVVTAGVGSITITLTGSDPESDDLVFSIVEPPTEGSLGPINQAPAPTPGDPPGCSPNDCIAEPGPARSSATVVYSPATAGDVEDSFTFRVTDPSGQTGMAPVRINPPGDPTEPDPPLDSVEARDDLAETTKNQAVEVRLKAGAPDGVELTFETGDGNGGGDPAHGELSGLTQGSEVPRRSATVTYTPDQDFTGSDSFDFTACGLIDDVEVCDTGTITVAIVAGDAVAHPQDLEIPSDGVLTIALTGTAGVPAESGTVTFFAGEAAVADGGREAAVADGGREAAFTDGAEIAGNVADDDGNGFGDNHNALPGATPVLMSAGVDLSGGPGSNGVVRMQIEWDIDAIRSLADSLTSAQVILSTNKGTIDSLDTFFFKGTADQDAALTDGDFEAPASALAGVVMPVPPGPTGTEGSFSFDVLGPLLAVLRNDAIDVFSIQGRVNEALAGGGSARGLQVYTTASGNLSSGLEPQLALATPPPPVPMTFSVLTLPLKGTLKDSLGVLITTVPTTLSDNILVFTPNTGATGDDDFDFQVFDGSTVASARIRIRIGPANCVGGVDQNGRPCT